MPVPRILVVAPLAIGEPTGPIAPKFEGAADKCVGLAAAYEAVARQCGSEFFDAGSVTTSSRVDGVHLDVDQHSTLGLALAEAVTATLWAQSE